MEAESETAGDRGSGYSAAQALIEKLIYAQESLQPHEQRVLISVIEQIYTNRKSLTGKERLRLRYRIAL